MKQFFEISLKLKEGPTASTILPLHQMLRGKLTIKPLQRLHVDYIEYILIAAASEEGATMFSTSAILSIAI